MFSQSFVLLQKKFNEISTARKLSLILLKNPTVLCNYNKICHQSAEKVSKEIAMNLLEHLIMLYVQVRIFSLVKKEKKEKS